MSKAGHSAEQYPKPNQPNHRFSRWVDTIRNLTAGAIEGKKVIPEVVENAQSEVAEASVLAARQLEDYLDSQLRESSILSQSEVVAIQNRIQLPTQDFHTRYGFRAQQSGQTLDMKRYVDMVVEDIERKRANGQMPTTNYELYPLREAIRFILKDQFHYHKDDGLENRVMQLEQLAQEKLSRLMNPMETPAIEVDGIVISRKTEYGTFRVFDVECYA